MTIKAIVRWCSNTVQTQVKNNVVLDYSGHWTDRHIAVCNISLYDRL